MQLRMSWLVLLVVLLAGGPGVAGLSADEPVAAGEVRRLAVGERVERELASGEEHAYLVEAKDLPLLITVEQDGIDAALEVLRSDGGLAGIFDAPTVDRGFESWVSAAPGIYQVRIRGQDGRGRYELSAEELLQSTPGEQARLAAERLATEAARLNKEKTADSRRRALALYEESLELWQKAGDGRREAWTRHGLAILHLLLGELRPALDRFREAAGRWEALGDRQALSESLTGVGLMSYYLGELTIAESTYQQVLQLQMAAGDRRGEARTRGNLCLVRQRRGDLREALACYEEVLRINVELDVPAEILVDRQNMAGLYEMLGEPDAARESYGAALALARRLKDRHAEAEILNNLGVLQESVGEMGEALADYNQALAIFREIGDRRWEVTTLRNLGAAYSSLGEPQQAVSLLEGALAQATALGLRSAEADVLVALGRVYVETGDTARAESVLTRALELAKALEEKRTQAIALFRLGEVLAAKGDDARALEQLTAGADLFGVLGDRRKRGAALERAAEICLRRGEPSRAAELIEEAVTLAREVRDPRLEAWALTLRARMDRKAGRLADAVAGVEKALSLLESLRTRVRSPDLRASFLGSQRQAYELAIDLRMELERREPGRDHARAALEISERARARGLLDLLQEAHTDVLRGVDPVLRERRRSLLSRLQSKAEPREGRGGGVTEQEIPGILAELDEVEAKIRAGSPRFAALTQLTPLRAAEIQALLDPGTLLLEYALGQERSYVWAVDQESVTGFELPGRAAIEAAARRFYDQLRTPQPTGSWRQEGEELARLLLGPVADRLGERRLAVIADGALHYLPFAALPEPGGDRSPLIVRHEVVNLPSASVLAVQRRELAGRPKAPLQVAVFADPIFTGPRSTDPARGGEEAGPAELSGLSRLPATQLEAAAIAALVPAEQRLASLGAEASRDKVLGGNLARYRIVHFATHGLIDSRVPQLSGLMLSQKDEHGRPQRGFLGLGDIYNLELAADLVVLSGCETALGKEIRGEGLVGLARGFMYAGAERVLASLWNVRDRATAELMRRFYRSLLQDGKPPAAALREAQLALYHERSTRPPYFWASFVLQGDWR